MFFSLHGTRVPHKKNTADMQAVRMPAPQTVVIPMQMHIGKPAIPIVNTGDKVYVGTCIAEPDGHISASIHSSISGTVKKIEDITISSRNACKAIYIESDGNMTPDSSLTPPNIDSRDSLIAAIKESGIVGLGGAGFPTNVKFNVEAEKIEELIVNGAECEPYITSDNRTMLDRVDDMKLALLYIEKYLGVKKIIIGVENNKPKAICSMQTLAQEIPGASVKALPSVYPQGGEKVLIYHTVKKIVPLGKLPIDVGCIVSNCTTIADIGKYIRTGIPLVEKCITVDGSAVINPMNVIVPIGTALSDVFTFAGGFKSPPGKVLYGGPMMGISVPNSSVPVLKNTNAVLAFNEHDSVLPKPQPCIKCGRCINTCPFGINPPELAKALQNHDINSMERFGADACMECGCCAFVCPANRPIVQNHRLIKAELRTARSNKTKGEKKQ